MNMTDQEFSDWFTLASGLRPIEQLCIVDLLKQAPGLKLTEIVPDRLVGEEKCFRTSRFIERHFREILYAYCDCCNQLASPFPQRQQQARSIAKTLAPLLITTLHVQAGIAIAISVWLLSAALESWCSEYGCKPLSGNGTYKIEPYGKRDDPFSSSVDIKISGVFSASYYPEISKKVKDPKYPLPAHIIEVYVRTRADVTFHPNSPGQLSAINSHLHDIHWHDFEFVDQQTSKTLSGIVDIFSIPPTGNLPPTGIHFQAKQDHLSLS